ncbi:hypothetical protein B5M09_002909 [Aphanomyces astaci]|uniref:Formate--tetrahydrofolate ligase n=1 Tax=Aphanomyces astaci TaxID=112090 RepID=A0A425DER6_APHAT|nr:hypothetical protein B5M09_002909 [Aphanomyces astaci]
MMFRQSWLTAAGRFRALSTWHLKRLPLQVQVPTPCDGVIASAQTPKRIETLAAEIGIDAADELKTYGPFKAKVSLDVLKRLHHQPNGKYVVVGGMTPTPLGEGKTTCDEFNMHLTGDIHAVSAATNLLAAAIDARMFHERNLTDATLYQRLVSSKAPSSSAQFTPAMRRRLAKLGLSPTSTPDDLTPTERRRFARLALDPATITVKRVVDTNDRFLRHVTVGQGAAEKGQNRATGFDITGMNNR